MLTLYRYNQTDKLTQGVLLSDGDHVADTLELPWKDNHMNESCIPEGTYAIEYREDDSHHVKMGYVIKDVPNRTDILAHPVSLVSQLLGCVGLGIKYGDALYYNTLTLQELHRVVGQKGTLKITSLEV